MAMIQSGLVDLTCCTDSPLIFSFNSVACQSQSQFPRIGSSRLWNRKREREREGEGKLPPSHFLTLQLSELRPRSPSSWLYCCPNSVSWYTCSPSASPAAQKIGSGSRGRPSRGELGQADLPRSGEQNWLIPMPMCRLPGLIPIRSTAHGDLR